MLKMRTSTARSNEIHHVNIGYNLYQLKIYFSSTFLLPNFEYIEAINRCFIQLMF